MAWKARWRPVQSIARRLTDEAGPRLAAYLWGDNPLPCKPKLQHRNAQTNLYPFRPMPFVAYTRVSTGKQRISGLGMEAQEAAIRLYACWAGEPILATFTEVESGACNSRPQLAAALDLCRRKRATFLIARLDRLSRSLAFIAQLLEAGVDIRAADMPEANRLTLQLLAVFGEHERQLISERTKAALAAAKARGTILGANGARLAAQHRREARAFALSLAAPIQAARLSGAITMRGIASYLNEAGVRSREGGQWHPASVSRLVRRLELTTHSHSIAR